jgi:predicted nucleic acid-binding protein
MGKRRPSRSPSPSRFVLDGSICLAWFFQNESSPYADGVARLLASSSAVVPSLWALEIANVLVMGERRRRSTSEQAAVFLSRLSGLPIVIDDPTAQMAWSGTMALARDHGISAYDAAYLELAIREGLPLATLDKQLRDAVARIGGALVEIGSD